MNRFEQSLAELRARLPEQPEFGIVLGSGLGPIAQQIENPSVIPYGEIPHMAVTTNEDHAGRFLAGRLSGRRVLCMQGRLHGYEGYDPETIVYPIRLMKLLGIRALLLTNAAGGMNPDFAPGDLMIIEDHLNFTGKSPLTGANMDELGPRFHDMTYAYDPALRELADQATADCGITLHHGVYVGVNGPQFETPAEIRAYRLLGGDAVGMSTVFEVIAAAHCGLPVLAISMITNMAAGMLPKPLSGAEVNETADQHGGTLQTLIRRILERLPGQTL